MKPLFGILLFTGIETVILAVWLVLAGVPFGAHVLAVVVLAIGLFFEHLVAYNVGAGRPLFSIPS